MNLISPDGVDVDSDPFVFPPDTGTRAFIRGSDNQLWERDLTVGDWTSHDNSLDVVLAGQPFVVGYSVGGDNGQVLSVLSTSNKNSLLEFRSRQSDIESGKLFAGPAQILMLEARLGKKGVRFINVTGGAGSDPTGDATRKIVDANNQTAILEEALDEVPDDTTVYEVYLELETGTLPPESLTDDDEILLDEDTQASLGNYIYLRKPGSPGQLRQIIEISDAKARVNFAWDEEPDDDDPYSILVFQDGGLTAKSGSARRVVLPPGPSGAIHAGLFLEVETDAEQTITREIKSFNSAIRILEVVDDLPSDVSAGADYRITVGTIDEGWQAYRDPDQTELRPGISTLAEW